MLKLCNIKQLIILATLWRFNNTKIKIMTKDYLKTNCSFSTAASLHGYFLNALLPVLSEFIYFMLQMSYARSCKKCLTDGDPLYDGYVYAGANFTKFNIFFGLNLYYVLNAYSIGRF